MNRRALVTGAAGGIGSAAAELLSEQGWTVVGVDRSWKAGTPEGSVELDLADHFSLADFVRGVGDLDALINVAAVMEEVPLKALSSEQITRTFDVNLTAAMVAASAAFDGLAARGGAVVNVASVHALASREGLAAYAASKGGLVAFTRQAAVELGPIGIRVNAVIPGAVNTPMLASGVHKAQRAKAIEALAARTPLGRVAEPREIAQAIEFLADSRRSGFVTGQTITADGGVLARLSAE